MEDKRPKPPPLITAVFSIIWVFFTVKSDVSSDKIAPPIFWAEFF